MDHFHHRDHRLFGEDVDLVSLAETHGTPLFVYSKATLLEHYRRMAEAFAPIDPLICYAVKSNANLSVLEVLGNEGAGMDVVSGGELYRALAAGVPAERCVYAGVGKTDSEIEYALSSGIGSINAESEEEIQAILGS